MLQQVQSTCNRCVYYLKKQVNRLQMYVLPLQIGQHVAGVHITLRIGQQVTDVCIALKNRSIGYRCMYYLKKQVNILRLQMYVLPLQIGQNVSGGILPIEMGQQVTGVSIPDTIDTKGP